MKILPTVTSKRTSAKLYNQIRLRIFLMAHCTLTANKLISKDFFACAKLTVPTRFLNYSFLIIHNLLYKKIPLQTNCRRIFYISDADYQLSSHYLIKEFNCSPNISFGIIAYFSFNSKETVKTDFFKSIKVISPINAAFT